MGAKRGLLASERTDLGIYVHLCNFRDELPPHNGMKDFWQRAQKHNATIIRSLVLVALLEDRVHMAAFKLYWLRDPPCHFAEKIMDCSCQRRRRSFQKCAWNGIRSWSPIRLESSQSLFHFIEN